MRTLTVLLIAASTALAEPTVFWASDPVRPDETVLVAGAGLGATARVELVRLDDGAAGAAATWAWPGKGTAVEVLQPSETSLKFVIPAAWKPGAYLFRVLGADGPSRPVRLNAPTVYWVQGDSGTGGSPGGWLRAFGRCLAGAGVKPTVRLEGPGGKAVTPAVKEATEWSVTVGLPAGLPAGAYHVRVHNGHGGPRGWSDGGAVTVAAPERWPSKVYNVADFGALGDGALGDATGLRAALAEAEANGGGVVYLPRGRYQVTGTLTIPKRTVLRGAGTELVCLFWPDTDEPYTLIEGTTHFGLENLTLYASNYIHGISALLGEPESGHVHVRNVRARLDMYRGHLKPEQVDERFRASLKRSTGGGDTIRLGGENIEITGCDLYGSGRSLYLHRARGGRVSHNTFYNGRWGWYNLEGSDKLILEHNRLLGADLMSTGGGISCYSSAYSQNVWYAHNELQHAHGWDREAMTTDAGYGAWFGPVTDIKPDSFSLTGDATWNRKKDWTGAGVFILGGRGMGQVRRIRSYDGRQVTLDRPWDVPPDEQSPVSITMYQGQYLFVGNRFEDVGIALQYYGTSIDCVATGNQATRGGGFYNSGRWYRHFQPSWYCQFLANEILEGNCYRFGANNAENAGVSYLGTYGLQAQGGTSPLALCSIHRRNRLHNNAELRFLGVSEQHPGLQDLIAEGNLIENTERGVYADGGCVGLLLRQNRFVNVTREQFSEQEQREEQRRKRQALLDQREPIAVYGFDRPQGLLVANDARREFIATATGAITYEPSLSGQAPRLTGAAYFAVGDQAMLQFLRLTVSAWVLPDQLKGRWGVVAKRSRGAAAPYVLAIRDGGVTFEATDRGGQWSYNLTTKPTLRAGVWNHLAAVCEEGVAVRLYCNGELVGEKPVTAPLVETNDVLTIGYENWGGPNSKPGESGNFRGLIDEVKLWSRLLGPEEIKAEYERLKAAGEADAARRTKAAADEQARLERLRAAAGKVGDEWKLVHGDDFERAELGPEWQVLRGKWTIKDGHAVCSGPGYLGCVKKVAAPVRIEYDARSQDPGDLTAFWGTAKAAYQGGYFIGFASNGNTGCKILRYGESVAERDGPVAQKNRWYHVVAQILGGRVQLLADGELLMDWPDPKPVTDADMAGVIAWADGEFDNLRIHTGK